MEGSSSLYPTTVAAIGLGAKCRAGDSDGCARWGWAMDGDMNGNGELGMLGDGDGGGAGEVPSSLSGLIREGLWFLLLLLLLMMMLS